MMVYKVLNDVYPHYLLDFISFLLFHSTHADLLSIPQTLQTYIFQTFAVVYPCV